MKISDDKKYFIIQNQFDKLPSEIIDYIYFFVDNFIPNEKHKNFTKNNLECFVNTFKTLKKNFNSVKFLLDDIIILDNNKFSYKFFKDENFMKVFEYKKYIKNNTILIFDNIHTFNYIVYEFITQYISSFCNNIQDYTTILKKKYYLKEYNNMMKKTTIKKLSKLLKEGQNRAIFEMLDYSKLLDYLCKYKNFVFKECLNENHFIIINENYELFLITNNNKPYY